MKILTETGNKSSATGELQALPTHVAIVMDGNGRWAERRRLPRHAGHRAGVRSVRTVVEESARRRIPVLTLFAFSSENWNRPKQEVSLLMDLFMNALHQEVKRLQRNNVRLRVVGDIGAFAIKLQDRIREVENLTSENDGLTLQIAANYGGRWDLTEAARKLARRVKKGELREGDITEESVAAELSFSDLPDPDLFIRTGGEQRLSNFMLWQAAYAELYFSDLLWPDFGAAAFEQALVAFSKRQRRFGRTGGQIRNQETGTR